MNTSNRLLAYDIDSENDDENIEQDQVKSDLEIVQLNGSRKEEIKDDSERLS